jgi:hypothetical protein
VEQFRNESFGFLVSHKLQVHFPQPQGVADEIRHTGSLHRRVVNAGLFLEQLANHNDQQYHHRRPIPPSIRWFGSS